MHPPLFTDLTGTTLATETAISYLAWILLSGLVGLVAVIRVLRQPAAKWKHPNWSRLAWVVAILYVAPILGGYPIPVAAIAAIWSTRRPRPEPAPPGQLPLTEGSADLSLPRGQQMTAPQNRPATATPVIVLVGLADDTLTAGLHSVG